MPGLSVLEARLAGSTHKPLAGPALSAAYMNSIIVLYSVGQVFLLLLLVTLLLAKQFQIQKRNPIMVNLIFSGLCSAITPCLLYYSGDEYNDNPSTGFCLAQAALKHGTTQMFLSALLCLSVEVLLTTRTNLNRDALLYRWSVEILIAFPYIVCIAFTLPIVILGIQDPYRVERLNFYYCSLKQNTYGTAGDLISVAFTLASVGIQGWIVFTMRKSWRRVRGTIVEPRLARSFDVTLFIRVCGVTFLQVVFIVIALVTQGNMKHVLDLDEFLSIFEATAPIFLFVLFGVKADLMRKWLFIKKKARSPMVTSIGSGSSRMGPALKETFVEPTDHSHQIELTDSGTRLVRIESAKGIDKAQET